MFWSFGVLGTINQGISAPAASILTVLFFIFLSVSSEPPDIMEV